MTADHVNELLQDPKVQSYIALDTNILIQLVDKSHNFHGPTINFFEKYRRKGGEAVFFYLLASKLELGEYLRKKSYTAWLTSTFSSGQSFLGNNSSFDTFCLDHEFVTSNSRPDEILTDRQIKELRVQCIRSAASTEEGLKIWENISQMALNSRYNQAYDTLKKLGITYKGFQDTDLFSEANRASWKEQEKLIQKFGLGSADAAILNMVNANQKITGLMTNDSDLVVIFDSHLVREGVKCYSFIRSFTEEPRKAG